MYGLHKAVQLVVNPSFPIKTSGWGVGWKEDENLGDLEL